MRRLLLLAVFCSALAGAAGANPLWIASHSGKHGSTPSLSKSESQQVGTLFMAMCLNHFTQGKLEWAEQACSQAIEADPQLADAYKLRGYAYLTQHRFERAEGDFRAALQLKPHDDQNIAGYGESLNGEGQFAQAVPQFRHALSLAPDRAAYWNGLCWALAGEGRQLKTALATCNRALLLVPGAAGILNSRAMVYLRLGQFSPALADYAASLNVQPEQASAWFGRGLARLSLGKSEGRADIAEARHRDPGVDSLFVQMGALPATCVHAGGPTCPPGFPPAPQDRTGAYQVAMLHADADQELVREIRADARDRAAK